MLEVGVCMPSLALEVGLEQLVQAEARGGGCGGGWSTAAPSRASATRIASSTDPVRAAL